MYSVGSTIKYKTIYEIKDQLIISFIINNLFLCFTRSGNILNVIKKQKFLKIIYIPSSQLATMIINFNLFRSQILFE